MLQVAIETRLVNAHDRAKTHRHGGKLPKVRHQPGMRIRGQAAAFLQLPAEIIQLLLAEPALQESARVEAGRSMALEIDLVWPVRVIRSLEEMVKADFVQGRRRGEGGDMAADG